MGGLRFLRVLVLLGKTTAVIFFFMLVRWSWPRFRFDQLMSLAWKVMLPLGVVNLMAVAIFWVKFNTCGGDDIHTIWFCLGGWLVAIVAWLVVAWSAPLVSNNRLPAMGRCHDIRVLIPIQAGRRS